MCDKTWCLCYHIAYVLAGFGMVYVGYQNIQLEDCSTFLGVFFMLVGVAFSGTFTYRCYLSECRGKYPEEEQE